MAQYHVILNVVSAFAAAHRDKSVNFEYSEDRLYIRISRPLAREDLTWLMLTETLEGLMVIFGASYGWFETSITILDDTADPVGDGTIAFER